MIAQHPALRRGVLYIEDFDDPVGAELVKQPAPAEIAAPSFSAEDLEAARQQSYADGVREGQASAARERAHAVRLLLESLGQNLSRAQQDFQTEAENIANSLAQTLFAALCGSLPAFCRNRAESETRDLVKRIMPGLAREARLEIKVHPDLVACVRDELSHLAQDLPEHLTVVGDSAMEFTDLRANWKSGHILRSSRQIWQDVRDQLAIEDLLPPTPEVPHAG